MKRPSKRKKLTKKEAQQLGDFFQQWNAWQKELSESPKMKRAFEKAWKKLNPISEHERYRITMIFNRGKMNSIEDITLNRDQETLLNVLTSAMKQYLESVPENVAEVLKSRIRGAVCYYKFEYIKPEQMYEYVQNDLKACLKGLRKNTAELTSIEKQALVNIPRLSKVQVCRLFGIDPKRPRTLERYVRDGYRGYHGGEAIKLKRKGSNGTFLIEDIEKFIQQTGKHSDLLQYFLNRSIKKER